MRPTLNYLDKTSIENILIQSKQILSEVGIKVQGAKLRERLLAGGLKMGENGRLHFPPLVVDQAVASAPKSFTLYNREGMPHAELGGDNVHFVPGSSGLNLLDHRTGQTRAAKTADFVEYVRLADGMPHIAYLATAFSTNDIRVDLADAWRLYLCLTHSLKPVVTGAFTAHGVPRMAEMMQLFRHDRADLRQHPFGIFTITASGNFRYGDDSCQNLLDCVEWGIPIEITPVTLMGLIAPVTLVEATIFHVADVLAGLTMAQIVRPGAPVLFGGAPATFNMKTATAPMVAIEAQQLNMAYVAVAKYLKLPTQAYMALSDGKSLDAQAGAETFGTALLAALAGINSVSGPGMLDYVMVFSLAKLVLDDELCGQALRFVREIAAVEDVPAMDLARLVIDGQHLLTADHTLRHWPEHLYIPGRVIDRLNRENWERAGSVSLIKRAAVEVDQRLAAYEAVETDDQIVQEMGRLMQAGQAEPPTLPDVPPLPQRQSSSNSQKHRRKRRT